MTLGRDLAVAFMFLTRLPWRRSSPWQRDDLAASVVMFPIVGAVVGLIGASAFAMALHLNLPALLAAALALAVMIGVTGALHEDGLGDVADGFGGGETPADKLRIMRDSALGSYGTLTLVLSVSVRGAALAALADPLPLAAAGLVTAGALSRAAMPLAMTVMPQARSDGVAATMGIPHPARAMAGGLIAVILACLFLPLRHAVIVSLAVTVAGALFLLLAHRQVRGVTGDVLGALQQITEIAALLTLVSLHFDA